MFSIISGILGFATSGLPSLLGFFQQKGDTLSGIAKAQGTTVAQILADNPTLAARQAAGQTVLFSGTKVLITAPNQATNPYAAATSGPAAGAGANVGTASVLPMN